MNWLPTPELLIDLEAVCRKHKVILVGADYHSGILVLPADAEKIHVVVEDGFMIDFK